MGSYQINYINLKTLMINMKKLMLVVFLSFLMLIPGVLAATFTVDVSKESEYLANRITKLTVIVNNYGPEDWFSVSVFGFPNEWISPSTPSIKVPFNGQGELSVDVHPSKDAAPTLYNYVVTMTRASDGEYVQKEFLIAVKQIYSSIIKDLKLSCFTCGNSIDVTGTVENVGTQPLDLTLEVSLLNDKRTIDIGTLDILKERGFTETFSLKDFSAGTYTISARLLSGDREIYSDSKDFNVMTIENVVYDKGGSVTPFGSFITITAVNDGNIETIAQMKSKVSRGWWSIFSGPEPNSITGNEFVWTADLNPGESAEVKYSEIYWPTYFMIIFIAIIGAVLYFQLTALTIEKSIVGKNTIRRGKEIHISLFIKNRKREIDNVIVRDIIPAGLSIIGTFETIKPVIRKITGGTELVWRIGKLKPHEERVINYKVKSLVEKMGKVHLPSAAIKARYEDKLILKKSNLVHLIGEAERISVVPVRIE
jgi:hypothetical protein